MNSQSAFAPITPEEMASLPDAGRPKAEKRPVVPVPDDAPPMSFRHPRYGAPTRVWPYHDADGRLCGYAARFEFERDGETAKDVLPITFCDVGGGRRAWRAKGIPSPRPLYRLPEILARPDAVVIVTEGEKAADAAADLFPDMVATTPMHGAKSPHLTDWRPLAGRTIVIAPDADAPGQDFADRVCDLLREAGTNEPEGLPTIRHLHPDRLGAWVWKGGDKVLRDGGVPEGWDLADALAEGWTAETLAKLREDPAFIVAYKDAAEREAERRVAAGEEPEAEPKALPFRVTDTGVEKRIEKVDKETGSVTVEWKWFCSELHVDAETRDAANEEWGRLLRLRDRDGKVKTWAMPMAILSADGAPLRERLLSLGLILGPSKFARDALHEYVSTARPGSRARAATRTGWESSAYVTPDGAAAGGNGERIIFQAQGPIDHAFRKAGTLEAWQDGVARFAPGNSRLTLAISAAFVGPLLVPTHAESGFLHFRGGSSTGKTTALEVAGSVWGGGGIRGWCRSWRATTNGLEGVAALHNDGFLCLDEMGQCDPREVGGGAYMLMNGVGKARAGRGGELRRAAEWRLFGLSSGEVGLAERIAETGRGRVAAGQQVRIIDIAADAGAGMGVFEDLHGFPTADAFARHLKTAARTSYGTAIRAFLPHLARDLTAAGETAAGFVREFVEENVPPGADGQVSRVAARFGLVAAAGEMATAWDVLPWEPGEATRAAERCFNDWLALRGGIEPAEEREAVATVRRFIEAHGASRFEPMGVLVDPEKDYRIHQRVGFKRADGNDGLEYLILRESWKAEVCAGLDPVAVAKALHKRGLLKTNGDGKLQAVARLPGYDKTTRVYLVPGAILGDDHA